MINSEQIQALKAAAEKATALDLDSAQLQRGNDGYYECPVCCGAGEVEAKTDFCNIDGVALGVQFYGIGEHHGAAEAYFRAANPATILSLLAERDADKALIAELEQKHCGGALMEREEHHVGVVNKLLERIAELEAHTLTVKFPEDWHFEECETEGCQNGALFSVGKAAKNLHLCEACAKEPANSRLSKTALPKRLPFRIAAGITLVMGE